MLVKPINYKCNCVKKNINSKLKTKSFFIFDFCFSVTFIISKKD